MLKGDPHMWKLAFKYSAVGMEMAIAICLGYFGGAYLDGKLNTTPWLTNICFACGIAAAFLSIYRIAKRHRFDDDQSGR